MKIIYKLFTFGVLLGTSMTALAQKDNVGIGTTKPDNSAALEVNSTNKGLLIPRLSLQQRNNIQAPATGLMVFQTDMLSGFYFYDGKDWKPLTSATDANSVAGVDGDWALLGNAGTTSANFIGTTDVQPLRFRVENVNAGQIGTSGTRNVFFGRLSGGSYTGTNNVGIGTEVFTAVGAGASNVGVGFRSLKLNAGGANNVAVGNGALEVNTAGSFNMAIGSAALAAHTIGTANTAIGNAALNKLTGDNSYNIGIGAASMFDKTSGSFNVGIGGNTLRVNISGSNNTSIGYDAGRNNTGSASLFLGYQAGLNETGSNKLYISNSSSAVPLIKGEFDNKNLKVNTGATVSQTIGFLAVGNFDAAFAMPSPTNTYRLIVEGGIITEKIKVAVKGSADWADYVFEPSYKLMSLDKVESFVKENKHLPNVPSADEMAKNGLDVSQTSAKLMEKIEELTLYMIEMNKEIKALKLENETLKKLK